MANIERQVSRPDGTRIFVVLFPAINRWAIISCSYGAKKMWVKLSLHGRSAAPSPQLEPLPFSGIFKRAFNHLTVNQFRRNLRQSDGRCGEAGQVFVCRRFFNDFDENGHLFHFRRTED